MRRKWKFHMMTYGNREMADEISHKQVEEKECIKGESKTNYPREMLDSEVPVMPSWETIPSRQSTAQIKEDKAETCTLLITVRVDTHRMLSCQSHLTGLNNSKKRSKRSKRFRELPVRISLHYQHFLICQTLQWLLKWRWDWGRWISNISRLTLSFNLGSMYLGGL